MTDSYKHAVLVIYAAFSNLGGSVDLISLGSYHISALHAAVQIQYLLYHCILSSSVVSLFWIHLFSLRPQCAFTLNVHIFFSSLGLPHNFRFLHINYIFFPVNSCGGLQLPFSLGFYSPLSDVLAKSAVFPFWRLIQCLALWVVSALIYNQKPNSCRCWKYEIKIDNNRETSHQFWWKVIGKHQFEDSLHRCYLPCRVSPVFSVSAYSSIYLWLLVLRCLCSLW